MSSSRNPNQVTSPWSLQQLIAQRRAYRSLAPAPINPELIKDLAAVAALAPSCFNNQPWRYIFVHDPPQLQKLFTALSPTNAWAKAASLIIAVFSQSDWDCQIKGRDYFLFDTGMATAFIILRATELQLVAHPIAGYDEAVAKNILELPETACLITLVIVGRWAATISPVLSENQIKGEQQRPERLPLDRFCYDNSFKTPFGTR